jgi:hypothetical protein
MKMKEWAYRALRTFLQTSIGYIVIALPNVDFSEQSKAKTALIGIGVSAVAAGLAAVMNINNDKEEENND